MKTISTVVLLISSLLMTATVSCSKSGGKSGAKAGGGTDQPVIDSSGKKIYVINPATGATITGSGITGTSPGFENTSVVIPPGTLSFPVSVSIYETEDVLTSTTQAALGVSGLTVAGPGVAVLPSDQSVAISGSLAITLPYSPQSGLTGDTYLNVLAQYPAEGPDKVALIPVTENPTSMTVTIYTSKFGYFQVVYSTEKIVAENNPGNGNVSAAIESQADVVEPGQAPPITVPPPAPKSNVFEVYSGLWGSGCRPDRDQGSSIDSVKVTITGNTGKVTSIKKRFSDQSCGDSFLFETEERSEVVQFSELTNAQQGIHAVDSTVTEIKLTLAVEPSSATNNVNQVTSGNESTDQNVINSGTQQPYVSPQQDDDDLCGKTLIPGIPLVLRKDDCINDQNLSREFQVRKNIVQVVGNMLRTGNCQESDDCVTTRPTALEQVYFTKITANSPRFDLIGPRFAESGSCVKYTLKSSQPLSSDLQLAQNQAAGQNGKFYLESSCSNEFESSQIAKIAANTSHLEFYYKSDAGSGDKIIDLRDASEKVSKGLISEQIDVGSLEAFAGSWDSGCVAEESTYDYKRTKYSFARNAATNKWELTATKRLFGRSDCAPFSENKKEIFVSSLTFWGRSQSAAGALFVQTTLYSWEQMFKELPPYIYMVCGKSVDESTKSVMVNANDCQNDSYYRNHFNSVMRSFKTHGNMLFVDCNVSGRCQIGSEQLDPQYFTKVQDEQTPLFSIIRVGGELQPESQGTVYLPPMSIGQCEKFVLKSTLALTEDIVLAQNQNAEDGKFYTDINCENSFSSSTRMLSGQSEFPFYFKPTPKFAPHKVILDMREGNNGRGLAALIVNVSNMITLQKEFSGDAMKVGQCYRFTVSALAPFPTKSNTQWFPPMTNQPSGYSIAYFYTGFESFGKIYGSSQTCEDNTSVAPTGSSLPISFQDSSLSAEFYFKPFASTQNTSGSELPSNFFIHLGDPSGNLIKSNSLINLKIHFPLDGFIGSWASQVCRLFDPNQNLWYRESLDIVRLFKDNSAYSQRTYAIFTDSLCGDLSHKFVVDQTANFGGSASAEGAPKVQFTAPIQVGIFNYSAQPIEICGGTISPKNYIKVTGDFCADLDKIRYISYDILKVDGTELRFGDCNGSVHSYDCRSENYPAELSAVRVMTRATPETVQNNFSIAGPTPTQTLIVGQCYAFTLHAAVAPVSSVVFDLQPLSVVGQAFDTQAACADGAVSSLTALTLGASNTQKVFYLRVMNPFSGSIIIPVPGGSQLSVAIDAIDAIDAGSSPQQGIPISDDMSQIGGN